MQKKSINIVLIHHLTQLYTVLSIHCVLLLQHRTMPTTRSFNFPSLWDTIHYLHILDSPPLHKIFRVWHSSSCCPRLPFPHMPGRQPGHVAFWGQQRAGKVKNLFSFKIQNRGIDVDNKWVGHQTGLGILIKSVNSYEFTCSLLIMWPLRDDAKLPSQEMGHVVWSHFNMKQQQTLIVYFRSLQPDCYDPYRGHRGTARRSWYFQLVVFCIFLYIWVG